MSIVTKTYKYGEGIILPQNVVKEGYDFLGWYDNSSLTGNSISSIGMNEEGDKYFYAKWNGILYQISYNLNGHGTQPSKTSYNYGEEYTPPDLTASGYSFTGWTPQKITTTTSGDMEFVAEWKSEEITGGSWKFSGYGKLPNGATINLNGVYLGYTSSGLWEGGAGDVEITLKRTDSGYYSTVACYDETGDCRTVGDTFSDSSHSTKALTGSGGASISWIS